MEEGIVVAEGRYACLGKEFVERELQIGTLRPLVLVEEEDRVARHHQDEVGAALLGQEEDVGDGLVDDGRRNLVSLLVEIEYMAPLSGVVFLVGRGAVRLALVLLLEESGRLLVVHTDEVLHLHDEHLGLAALSEDVAHGDDLHGVGIVLHHEPLVVGMVGVVAEDAEQTGVEVVGMLDGILGSGMHVDDEVLVVVVFLLQGDERRVERLHLVAGNASALLHLLQKVVTEVTRGEVVAHVLYETVFYVVCHRVSSY